MGADYACNVLVLDLEPKRLAKYWTLSLRPGATRYA
jgi:hypothetical protein